MVKRSRFINELKDDIEKGKLSIEEIKSSQYLFDSEKKEIIEKLGGKFDEQKIKIDYSKIKDEENKIDDISMKVDEIFLDKKRKHRITEGSIEYIKKEILIFKNNEKAPIEMVELLFDILNNCYLMINGKDNSEEKVKEYYKKKIGDKNGTS